jgi:hypothetical protein
MLGSLSASSQDALRSAWQAAADHGALPSSPHCRVPLTRDRSQPAGSRLMRRPAEIVGCDRPPRAPHATTLAPCLATTIRPYLGGSTASAQLITSGGSYTSVVVREGRYLKLGAASSSRTVTGHAKALSLGEVRPAGLPARLELPYVIYEYRPLPDDVAVLVRSSRQIQGHTATTSRIPETGWHHREGCGCAVCRADQEALS